MRELSKIYKREKRAALAWSRLPVGKRSELPRTVEGYSILEYKGHKYAVGFNAALRLPLIREIS